MISVIILTYNEELDLPGCLGSLAWCDDVHIVDSGSTDQTQSIAQASGVHFAHHAFESFGKQRNWALENSVLRHDWVLFLDADERSTAVFETAMRQVIDSAEEEVAGFYCCWKLMLRDQWLKYSDTFPKWQFRLLRRGRARFTDYGHGQKEAEIQGRLDYLRVPYLHFAFSKGWTAWLERHNRYSSLEARARLDLPVRWQNLFSLHGSARNQALKPLLSRIPGWPLISFLVRFIAKGGFLDGRAGLTYSINMAYYEFLIRLKMEELRRNQFQGQSARPAHDAGSFSP